MKLTEEVKFRISKQDKDNLKKQAQQMGLTVGAYCRMKALKTELTK